MPRESSEQDIMMRSYEDVKLDRTWSDLDIPWSYKTLQAIAYIAHGSVPPGEYDMAIWQLLIKGFARDAVSNFPQLQMTSTEWEYEIRDLVYRSWVVSTIEGFKELGSPKNLHASRGDMFKSAGWGSTTSTSTTSEPWPQCLQVTNFFSCFQRGGRLVQNKQNKCSKKEINKERKKESNKKREKRRDMKET